MLRMIDDFLGKINFKIPTKRKRTFPSAKATFQKFQNFLETMKIVCNIKSNND